MAARRKRRAPTKRRRKTRSTRKGQVRKTARRAYSRRRPNPVTRRRRRVVAKRNPAGDVLMGALIAGGAGAILAAINQKLLIEGPAKAAYELKKTKPEATKADLEGASAIPVAIRSGWGNILTVAGAGVGIALMMDAWSKKGSNIQKAAIPVAAGSIAYAAATAVHGMMMKSALKEDWGKQVAANACANIAAGKNPDGTELGVLMERNQAALLAESDLSVGTNDVGELMEGRLPYGYF